MAMHVEYDTGLDELADAQLRALAHSGMVKRMRRRGVLWMAVLTAVPLYLYLALRGASLAERLVFAGLGVLIALGGYALTWRRSARKRLRKYLLEQFQSDRPIRFMVELRDDCIWIQQDGVQLLFDWNHVSEVVDAGDAVEFYMKNGGFVMVRNKGFVDAQGRAEFLDIARKRKSMAGAPPAN